MSTEPGPVFVERRAYRRRRVVDAARLLPILGVVLVCLPLLWTGEDAEPTMTTFAMIYFFGLWVALVVAVGFLSRHLKSDSEKEAGLPETSPPGDAGTGTGET